MKQGIDGRLKFQTAEWLKCKHQMRIAYLKTICSLDGAAKAVSMIGEKLLAILLGDMDPIPFVIANDLLEKFYDAFVSLKWLSLAPYAEKYAHQYPNMKVLEIDGGRGRTRFKSLLQ